MSDKENFEVVCGAGASEFAYPRHGDYLIPNLTLPETSNAHIGKYGLLRKAYLKSHRKVLYTNLLTSGKLCEHLVEIDRQADSRLLILMKHMAETQGITEKLKAADQMAWVGAMNNIKACAEEIICKDIIYA